MFLLRHLPLAVRLALVKAVHGMFLLWKPRYDSLAAVKRATGSPPSEGEDEEFTPKDDGAWQSRQAGRPAGPGVGAERNSMDPMFIELFIETDADDLLAKEDRRRRMRRSRRARPATRNRQRRPRP
jgi:hypothetical protein